LQVNVDGTIKSGSKNLSILTHTPDSGNYIVVPKDALNPDRILAIAINMEGAPNTYGIAIGIGPDPFDIQVSSYIPAGTLADSAFFILVWVGAINP
jgi:hypothetical protein